MNLQLIRHATLLVDMGSSRILVDPMLSKKGDMEPVTTLTDSRRNPTVELPFDTDTLLKLIEKTDAVLVTHTHRDHFDSAAAELLPKSKTLFCQPGDEVTLKDMGFKNVLPVHAKLSWNGIDLVRTSGHHGRGIAEKKLGVVSGFVLRSKSEPILYIAGDTILCTEVEEAIEQHQPDITVVNAGAAHLMVGGPITMNANDIINLCSKYAKTKVVAVHLEAFNHCSLTREKLSECLNKNSLSSCVIIPKDGELLQF